MKRKVDEETPAEVKPQTGTESRRSRRDSSSIIWGIIVITVGVILLFNNLGIIPWEFWNSIRNFWPVILILLGLHAVFGDSVVARLAIFCLTIVIVGITVAYGLYTVGAPISRSFSPDLLMIIRYLGAVQL